MLCIEDLRNNLLLKSDKKIAEFNKKICPDTKKEIIGIKVPELRKIAKSIVKNGKYIDYLNKAINLNDKYFEEIIIQGLIIGYSKMDLEDKFLYTKMFIPKIDSWAISDTFIPTFKFKEEDLEKVWSFIQPYTKSKKEFEVRFAVIMMLDYFINNEYVNRVIEVIDSIYNDKYYAEMAMAWTLAEIGIKYKDILMKYLKGKNNLDKFTYNKTLQKMIESNRVPDNDKVILKRMKIK